VRARRTLSAMLLLGAGAAALGCAPATVRSGLPPATAAPRHYDKWHAAFLFGALEASGPYDLGRLCPDGWSEISVGHDPFTVLAGAVTLFIYSPARVSVVCAAKASADPPRVGDGPASSSAEGRGSSSPAPPAPESF
jgi:hypothetical protein